jgi:serine/threonine protein phosphatase PrpC
METLSSGSLVEWGAAGKALAGEVESGDRFLVEPLPDRVLVAVMDGLGHGVEASYAAQKAVNTLRENASEPVSTLVRRCHEALRGTRGVALSLAVFDAGGQTLTWLGVGNVEGALLRREKTGPQETLLPPRETLMQRGGVVGYQLPHLREVSFPISPGDLLLLTTDGVRHGFLTDLRTDLPVQTIADHILAQYGLRTDDALVLAVRYLGRES